VVFFKKEFDACLLSLGGPLMIPIISELGGGNVDLSIQIRGKCLQALSNLFLKDAHQIISIPGFTHPPK
jgi:hypothetical protein